MPSTITRALGVCLGLVITACTAEVSKDPAAESGGGLSVAISAGPEAADDDCAVSTESTWIDQESPLRRYTVEAHTLGSTCDNAVAVLVIRAREGSPLFTWSGRVQDLFGLKDAGDANEMKSALDAWISNRGGITSTADLPAWETTDGQPNRMEFPFMPESWIDQSYWDTLKSEDLDMFCFPQGAESMNCAVLRDGQMEEIGLQLFPG